LLHYLVPESPAAGGRLAGAEDSAGSGAGVVSIAAFGNGAGVVSIAALGNGVGDCGVGLGAALLAWITPPQPLAHPAPHDPVPQPLLTPHGNTLALGPFL
jgi:hypothetical protein